MPNPNFGYANERSQRSGRVIAALVLGSFFLVFGLIGVKPEQGVVHAPAGQSVVGRAIETPRWEGSPNLSQVALGIGLIVLGLFWYHRLADSQLNVFRQHPPSIRNVGAGKSAGALRTHRNRLSEPRE
jgi:hypothetical protein